ncbi:MAG: hypothetical protein IJL80_04650, partial [Treponema sp.]|nr:hypothetical protein [Treponema sp.]
MTRNFYLMIATMLLAAVACHKQPKPEPEPDPVPPVETVIPAVQSKFYMTAAEDLEGKVSDNTAGLKVLLQ